MKDEDDVDLAAWYMAQEVAAARQNGNGYHSENIDDAARDKLYFLSSEFRAKHRIYSARELAALQLPPVMWCVEGMIPQGLAILAARMKVGKTNFASLLAKSVATGEDFLGLRVQRGRVLYLQYEDSDQLAQRRIHQLELQDVDDVDIALAFGTLADKNNMKDLGNMMISGCYKLVVVDTFERSHIGAKTDDRQWLMDAFDKLQRTARQQRMTILLIDHLNKSFERYGDIFDAVAESSVKIANADTLLALSASASGGSHVLKIRSRYAMEASYTLRCAPGSVEWEIVDDLPASARKIYHWMQAGNIGIVDAATIHQQLNIPSTTTYRAMATLVERQYLTKAGSQWRLPNALEARLDTASSADLINNIDWSE